jgi:DNA-directed RNA polymerase subunit E'/Rpb7
MALQQIFFDLTLHDIIIAEPWQLNNELYLHLKQNLRNKIEKKCIDAGYICRISDIIDYKDGYLIPEDFSGNVFFKIKYNAKVCNVVPKIQMICKIEQMVKGIIVAKNGPVLILIKYIDINPNLFKINSNGNIEYGKNKKVLSQDMYLKITVKSKKMYNGEAQIGVIGYIDDIATDELVNQYMYKEYDDEGDIIKPTIIKDTLMNEDEGIEEIIPQTKEQATLKQTKRDDDSDKGFIMDI